MTSARLVCVLVFVAVQMVIPSGASAADLPCHDACDFSGSVGATDDALGVYLQGGLSGGRSATRPTGHLQYDYHPACNGICTGVNAGAGAACSGAEQLVLVAVRDVTAGSPWTLQGTSECLSPAQQLPFDPAQLQATVDDYFQRIPLPTPGLRVSPADNAVVNLPEIVSANAPGRTTFTVNVAPFPTVTINATVRWLWDFGDGETLTTSTPGSAYNPADPDIAHYVTHTYRKANPGWRLSVTSVWTATYTVAGMPGTQTVSGAVRRTSVRTLRAADYGSTLTGN